jgi:NAD(P)-dependent dehydrogenase (short-subunit alcohol dehydrogenase family)
MAGMCEGRVVIVTGAGRGIGRGHAIEFAAQGAKVVVNDLGALVDGTGADAGPANEVVEAITDMGGEAIANGEDVSDFDGAKRLIDAAIERFGAPGRAGEQRRHPAGPDAHQHDRRGVGRRHQGAPAGHVRAGPPRRRLLAGAGQGR